MTLSLKDRIQLIALLFASAAGLSACGGGGGADTQAPTPSPPPPVLATGDLSTTVQPTTYASGTAQILAYQRLNDARVAFGSGTVAQNASLDEEAQAQADYILMNYLAPNQFGGETFSSDLFTIQPDGSETGHVMLQGKPGYVAYAPWDRAQHFGYPSGVVGESAAFPVVQPAADPIATSCVQQLLTSPGHRELLLDPRFRDFGLGTGTATAPAGTGSSIYQSDCYIATAAQAPVYGAGGMATAPAAWVGLFPADGSVVSSTGDGHGHGFAPSVTVDSHYTLTVTSFTVTDGNGASVPVTMGLDALSTSMGNWAVATPNSPLSVSTKYTAHFVGIYNGTPVNKTWSFTTPAQ